jgi:hypothetical protein
MYGGRRTPQLRISCEFLQHLYLPIIIFGFKFVIVMGGVVKVDIYEVYTKIELYVDTFLLGL